MPQTNREAPPIIPRTGATHPERVYSREQLLNNVWGTNVYVEDRTVDVHIRRLRKAIEETGHDRLIQTVRGAGYRFSTRL